MVNINTLVKDRVTLKVEAGKVSPGPKIASSLGPKGIPMRKFCDEVNERTGSSQYYNVGDLITVKVKIYQDKSYTFTVHGTPASELLKKYSLLDKGSTSPGKDIVAKIKMADIINIAKIKMADMNADTLDEAVSMILGTASSMGIDVIEE